MKEFIFTLGYVLAGVVRWFIGKIEKDADDQDYPVDER